MNLFPTTQEKEGSEFADYQGFTVEFREASHRYWIITGDPEEKPECTRTPVVSVTSAIGILEKRSLLGWYARTAAMGVLERPSLFQHSTEWTILDDLKINNLGPEVKRDAGASRGTAVHEMLRKYVQEGVVPSLAGLSDEVRGYCQALAAWLVDAAPEPLMAEQIVGSPQHGFAGRFDLLANINANTIVIDEGSTLENTYKGNRKQRVLIDLKTSPGAHKYPEAHLQMAGYELAFPECGIEPVDHSLILALTDSGHYELGEGVAEASDFLAILSAQKAVGSVRKSIKVAQKDG